jgi:hypothetical protein
MQTPKRRQHKAQPQKKKLKIPPIQIHESWKPFLLLPRKDNKQNKKEKTSQRDNSFYWKEPHAELSKTSFRKAVKEMRLYTSFKHGLLRFPEARECMLYFITYTVYDCHNEARRLRNEIHHTLKDYFKNIKPNKSGYVNKRHLKSVHRAAFSNTLKKFRGKWLISATSLYSLVQFAYQRPKGKRNIKKILADPFYSQTGLISVNPEWTILLDGEIL